MALEGKITIDKIHVTTHSEWENPRIIQPHNKRKILPLSPLTPTITNPNMYPYNYIVIERTMSNSYLTN